VRFSSNKSISKSLLFDPITLTLVLSLTLTNHFHFNDTSLLKFPHFNFPQDKSEKPSSRQDHSPVYGKDVHHPPGFNVGYLVSPYSYANGAAALPVSMVSLANCFTRD
jgi:hypothetical protein